MISLKFICIYFASRSLLFFLIHISISSKQAPIKYIILSIASYCILHTERVDYGDYKSDISLIVCQHIKILQATRLLYIDTFMKLHIKTTLWNTRYRYLYIHLYMYSIWLIRAQAYMHHIIIIWIQDFCLHFALLKPSIIRTPIELLELIHFQFQPELESNISAFPVYIYTDQTEYELTANHFS